MDFVGLSEPRSFYFWHNYKEDQVNLSTHMSGRGFSHPTLISKDNKTRHSHIQRASEQCFRK